MLLLLVLLVADVLAPHLLIEPHRADAVAPRPEVEPSKVLLATEVLAMDPDGGFPLQKAHGVGNAELGRDAQAQMHVVGHGMALHQLNPFLVAQLAQDLPYALA